MPREERKAPLSKQGMARSWPRLCTREVREGEREREREREKKKDEVADCLDTRLATGTIPGTQLGIHLTSNCAASSFRAHTHVELKQLAPTGTASASYRSYPTPSPRQVLSVRRRDRPENESCQSTAAASQLTARLEKVAENVSQAADVSRTCQNVAFLESNRFSPIRAPGSLPHASRTWLTAYHSRNTERGMEKRPPAANKNHRIIREQLAAACSCRRRA
ncbi:hypothetical protein IWX46DRAFT_579791 [Phyllosticta citricarpa]|uniref:Uncharacterized protein n=1 Tax=Phyllosticta citricarpa TaxID=55181 RepID=A0ABR1MHM7_9PEZI